MLTGWKLIQSLRLTWPSNGKLERMVRQREMVLAHTDVYRLDPRRADEIKQEIGWLLSMRTGD